MSDVCMRKPNWCTFSLSPTKSRNAEKRDWPVVGHLRALGVPFYGPDIVNVPFVWAESSQS